MGDKNEDRMNGGDELGTESWEPVETLFDWAAPQPNDQRLVAAGVRR